MSDTADAWTKFYGENSNIAYPAEGVIRILKGTYPYQKMPPPKPGQSILEIGCGDGRHFSLFQQLGLKAHGTEITDEICSEVWRRLTALGITPAGILKGICSDLPFTSGSFDYLLAWNSCNYMSLGTGRFEDHVIEMHRALKPDGWIIVSIPARDCFIFDDCTYIAPGYRLINSEHFGLRQGELMYMAVSKTAIEEQFSPWFADFSHAMIDIQWFGLRYAWHVFTARKCSSTELPRLAPPSSETTDAQAVSP